MDRVELIDRLGPAALPAVRRLLDAATEADDHPPFDEATAAALLRGDRSGAALLEARTDTGHPVGLGRLDHGRDLWGLDVVVHPDHRRPTGGPAAELARAAVDHVAAQGGGDLRWWISAPRPGDERTAAAVGLEPARTLYQMRCPLPLPGPAPDPAGLRTFVPGRDEDAWLAVNNRAFAWHPEQGGWDRDTLAAHATESWFDPAGFLLHETDGTVDGFCWTKVHAATHPPMGEIYVIAVDPSAGGRGLGRTLVAAGLDSLHRRAGTGVGMLYVDAGNAGAVKLYVDMAFTIHHVDVAFTGRVAPR